MDRTDIAIVGAGLVGTPLAQVLARQGWSVALLDANDSQAVLDSNSTPNSDAASRAQRLLAQRCTALSLGTQRWLKAQKLWTPVADDACPIKQVHVSHQGYFGATRLDADELHAEAVGFVVSNKHFNAAMLDQMQSRPVQHIDNARVRQVRQCEDGVLIDYADKQLHARLLIGADGVSSIVRESAGIGTKQVDYDQCALLGTVHLERDHESIAYERFTPSGPLALLPRPDRYMTFVDCLDPVDADHVGAMNDEQYLARLQQRFGYRLGRFQAVGPRFQTPLVRIEATEQIAPRTLLLGNAVRLLHPVGGQGFNLAMRDVAQLVQLLDAQRQGDPGSAELLSRFVELRKRDQSQVVHFTDLLARGFRGKASLPGHVRASALLALDAVAPLRQQFARRTMGVA